MKPAAIIDRKRGSLAKRLGWMALIWGSSVLAMFALAFVLRQIMKFI